jgi:hypothetical protein
MNISKRIFKSKISPLSIKVTREGQNFAVVPEITIYQTQKARQVRPVGLSHL